MLEKLIVFYKRNPINDNVSYFKLGEKYYDMTNISTHVFGII